MSHHFKVDLNTLIVIICTLISFLIIGFISLCLCECAEIPLPEILSDANNRSSRRRRSGRSSTRGLSMRIRETFPIFVYSHVKRLKLGKEVLECAICLNEFDESHELRLLPECNHVYHRHCIDSWLATRITCPVCRSCLIPKVGLVGVLEPPGSPLITDAVLPYQITGNLIVPVSHLSGGDEDLLGKQWFDGKRYRSKSMGNLKIQTSEENDKYKLRLPKEVLDQLLKSDGSRSGSCVSFPRERSLVKGYRSRSFRIGKGIYSPLEYERFDFQTKAKSDRWVFSLTPPCFPGGSSNRLGNGSEMTVAGRRKSFGLIRSPVERLFRMTPERESERIGALLLV